MKKTYDNVMQAHEYLEDAFCRIHMLFSPNFFLYYSHKTQEEKDNALFMMQEAAFQSAIAFTYCMDVLRELREPLVQFTEDWDARIDPEPVELVRYLQKAYEAWQKERACDAGE